MKFFVKEDIIAGPLSGTTVEEIVESLKNANATDIRIEDNVIYARVDRSHVRNLRLIANVFVKSKK